MNEEIKSVLSLDSIAFEEISYKRNIFEKATNPQYEMNFERTVSENEDHIHYCVSIASNIRSKDNSITIRVKLTGIFSCECEDENIKKALINENAVAILFPYLRSQVTLVSTQPELPSIIIPPVNIVEMFKGSEQDNKD